MNTAPFKGPDDMIGKDKLFKRSGQDGLASFSLRNKVTPAGADERDQAWHGLLEVMARYEFERQAFALMDRPSIARAQTNSGQPKFRVQF